MRQSFDGLGDIGQVEDQPTTSLPKKAWSSSRNVRYRDGAVEVFSGQTPAFATPLGSPTRVMPIAAGSAYYWVYPATTAVYATDGVSHANVSSVSASYSATDSLLWNGGAFNGFMTLNESLAPPTYWDPDLGNRFTELPAWDPGTLCQVLRPFRNYLMGYRWTEAGVYNPRLVRWSNGADPGTLPDNWDPTDPNVDTGRFEMGQTLDRVVDSLPLRDVNVIYKENYTWMQQWVGGNNNPFVFRQVFSQIGMLSEWCAAAFEGSHCVFSTNDVVVHDLNQAQSIVDKRMRRWLFNRINPDQISNCFVAPNYSKSEMWICFPESGHTFANLALVWNWTENTIQVRELGTDTPHINWGIVQGGISTSFDTQTDTFDQAAGAFDGQGFNPSITSMLMADPATPRLLQVDEGADFNGAPITATWEKESLVFGAIERFKHIKRIYPKVVGNVGDVLSISIGQRKTFEDPIVWSVPKDYTVGVDRFVNFNIRTLIPGIRFSTNDQIRLHGFDIEFDPGGLY